MAQPFPLPISYGHTDAVKNSGGWLINWEAEVAPKDARTPVTLRGSPGLDRFAECIDVGGISQPIVDAVEVDGAGYIITKTGLFRVFADGGTYQLATFALRQNARAATNGVHIVAVDGLRTWSYTIQTDEQSRYDNSTPFTDFGVELTADPNYYPSNTVTFMDGYFVFDRAGTQQVFNSEQYSLTVLPLAFKAAESSPDDVIAVLADHQVLNVIGSKSSEFWYDAGVGDMPFQRVEGGVVEHGTASAYCIAKNKNNTFVVASEGVVYAYQGYTPRPISVPAIEDELRIRDLTTATAFCYDDGGHPYYHLAIAGVGDVPAITLVYDLSTNLWHRRRDQTYGRYRCNCAIQVFGKTLVGDYVSGKVYEIGPHIYSIDGDPLVADIIPGPMPTAGDYADFNLFELEMDAGVGNADCPEPQIGLEVSNDDGVAFGNQRLKPIGAVGERKTHIRWRQLGSAYWRRYRIRLSDPVKRSMASLAYIE